MAVHSVKEAGVPRGSSTEEGAPLLPHSPLRPRAMRILKKAQTSGCRARNQEHSTADWPYSFLLALRCRASHVCQRVTRTASDPRSQRAGTALGRELSASVVVEQLLSCFLKCGLLLSGFVWAAFELNLKEVTKLATKVGQKKVFKIGSHMGSDHISPTNKYHPFLHSL